MRDLPEWLEESAENLVDGEASIPEAAGPREPSIPEPRTKVESEKHHVFTPFPKDQYREVSRRTKITRCPFAENAPVIKYHAPKMLVT